MFTKEDAQIIKYATIVAMSCLISLTLISCVYFACASIGYIDLPEEIGQAKSGDRIHYEIKNDTLHINFSKIGNQAEIVL